MPARSKRTTSKAKDAVEELLSSLTHPLKPALLTLRAGILAASPLIVGGVKWNAPSFHLGDERYFATASIHARGKAAEAELLVLHRGAKAKRGRVLEPRDREPVVNPPTSPARAAR